MFQRNQTQWTFYLEMLHQKSWPKNAETCGYFAGRRRNVLITSITTDFSISFKYHNSVLKTQRIFGYAQYKIPLIVF